MISKHEVRLYIKIILKRCIMEQIHGHRVYQHQQMSLLLNSKDANQDQGGDYQFQIELPRAADEHHLRMRLVNVVLPNTKYPIDRNNNVVYINEAGNPLTLEITINEGGYTVGEIITELTTKINAAIAGTVTITFNSSTHYLTFACTTSLQFLNAPNALYRELGFEGSQTESSVSVMSTVPIDLTGTKAVNIFTNMDTNVITSDPTITHLLAHVPISGGFNSTIYFDNLHTPSVVVPVGRLGDLRVWMRDDLNRRYILPSSSNWTMLFTIDRIHSQHIIRQPHIYQEDFADRATHIPSSGHLSEHTAVPLNMQAHYLSGNTTIMGPLNVPGSM